MADRKTTPKTKTERPYAGRSASVRREARREKIIGAALALFCDRGYAKTTIEALCKKARVATRDFYAEFATREALLAAVLGWVMQRTRLSVMTALANAGDDPFERMEAGLAAFAHAYLDDRRYARIVLIETSGVSSEMTLRRRGYIHEFADIIAAQATALAQSGVLGERDYSLEALALAGAVNELMFEGVYSPTPPTVDRVIEECYRIFRAVMAWERNGREN